MIPFGKQTMGLHDFSLVLDSPHKTYYPGTVVRGKVLFSCSSKALEIKGIQVFMVGKESVRWETGSGDRYKVHSGTQMIINEAIFLQGDGRASTSIPPGYYELPFNFFLPKGIPPSFYHEIGNVTYHIEAQIQQSWWKFDKKVKTLFRVPPSVDLKNYLDLAEPACVYESKTTCCWCCSAGQISVTMIVRKKGYVPGESIHVQVDAENESSRNVTHMELKLLQRIFFHANDTGDSKIKYDENELAAEKSVGIKSGESAVLDWDLIVPQVLPSSVGRNIISIRYLAVLDVSVGGPGYDMQLEMPLWIGTEGFADQGVSEEKSTAVECAP